MNGPVAVIGGGVAGLCCAWYLSRGADVVVIESNRIGSGSSYANGGWICPAQAGPLPEPGLTMYGIRSLLDPDSALYFKPSELPRLMPWLLRFRSYCTADAFARGTAALAMLGAGAFALVDEMREDGVAFELHKRGLVYAARDARTVREALRKLEPMREHGYTLPETIACGDALHELEPALSPAVSAGFEIGQHWHVAPHTLTAGLADALRGRGVEILEGAEVRELVTDGRRIRAIRSAAGDLEPAVTVLAAGAWTTALAASIGVALPMEPGKGYSFSVTPTVMPRHALLLADAHVGCSPFADGLRIAGTMEFSGVNSRLDRRRLEAIVAAAGAALAPWQTPEIRNEWTGMRPVTADGLPVVDRVPAFDDLYLATGYGMQGVTVAPTAGHALAEMISTGRRPALLEPFRLDRFGSPWARLGREAA